MTLRYGAARRLLGVRNAVGAPALCVEFMSPRSPILRLRAAGLFATALLFAATGAAHAQQSRVTVEGLPAGLRDEARRLLPEEPRPDSLFEARRQADRAGELVARLMESEGYYKAEIEPEAGGAETFTRSVRLTPGPLFTFGAIAVEYLGPPPDQKTQDAVDTIRDGIAIGEPARAQPVIEIGDAMVRILRASGYADAEADPVDALADGALDTVDITFRLKPGLRASFGEVLVSGTEKTDPAYLRRLRPWKEGELFSPRQMDEYRSRLAETGLFDASSAQLSPTPENATGAPARDVLVEVTERPRHTIALGGSASTSEGYGVEGEWDRRNLTGRGDTLSLRAGIATLNSSVEAKYERPNVGRYGRDTSISIGVENVETDAYDLTGGGVTAMIEEQFTPRFLASLTGEAVYASINDERARALGAGRREVYLLSAAVAGEYVGVRDILDPQDGVRARLAVEPGVTFGDTNIGFTRISGEASIYGDAFTSNVTAALRGRVGAILGPDGAPPDRLFFAGGGGSVRGYEYQSLSPRNAAGELSGGRSIVETSAELRWRFSESLGFVGFLDAGAAGEGIEPPFEDMRMGAGLGVRYYAGFGPIRADIAIPLDKREGDGDFQIYLSIGQAF